jgi:hypothetical protein
MILGISPPLCRLTQHNQHESWFGKIWLTKRSTDLERHASVPSGSARRAGFCPSLAASIAAATIGEAAASRSAWSVSSASIASSS